MNGCTLILDAFWVSDKTFPTVLYPGSGDGRIFYDLYTGTARYLGWLDLVLLKDIVKKSNVKHIILQNLDTLGQIAQHTRAVKVCTSYDYEHYVVNSLSKVRKPEHCKPIYRDIVLGGWDFSDEDSELDIRAQSYIKYLLVRTRVNSITCMNSKIKFTASLDFLGNVKCVTEPNL